MNRAANRLDAPVAILGAGPIGIACSLMLARRGIASVLIDARSVDAARQDRRLLALSRGTLQVLGGLLGRSFAPLAPIRDVHVSSFGQFGAARLSSRDFAGADLGATCWYADLVGALAMAADREPLVSVRRPYRVTGLEQSAAKVRILLEGVAAIDAPLAISAEGTPAPTEAPRHLAILADVRMTGLAAGVAIERFTRLGPLALLPVPCTDDATPDRPASAHSKHSMIWCLQQGRALEMLALDGAAFTEQVASMLGPRIGRVVAIGPRLRFPLIEQRRGRLREHRTVYIGNAAQSLHPVAGQGFNLGMRDGSCLADCLSESMDDPIAALESYASARRLDRLAIGGVTSWLPRAFARAEAPIASARSAGLLAVDLVAPLRKAVASLLMFGWRP